MTVAGARRRGIYLASGFAAITSLSTGCVTQLGYVPSYVKSRNEGSAPSYDRVRKWAVKVRNGYDTRMTLNRYAGYYGMLFAGAAAGAMTGLAAFDSRSSALAGIPIGTAFLGSVAAIFQNSTKALAYEHASRYVSELIALSDERIERRVAADMNPNLAEAEARKESELAAAALRAAEARLEHIQKDVSADLAAVAAEKDPDRKKYLQDRAAASQKLLADTEKAVGDAEVRVKASDKRLQKAQTRVTRGALTDQMRARKDAEAAEAFCLQHDVNAVMAKLTDLLIPLDPNAQEALRAVKAQGGTKAASDTKPVSDTKLPEKPPVLNLPDFDLPAKSICDNDV